MFASGGLFGLVLLAVWVWALYDVITTPNGAQRNLPKVAWVFIVFLFWVIGAFAWIVLGRPYAEDRSGGSRPAPPGRGRRRWHPSDARDDAEHLSDRERIELERRAYYKEMDEELDRRLEEKRRLEGLSDEGV